MRLCRLIYCSKASREVLYLDLKSIMEQSVKNNTKDGITGILCFGNSMFLQMLEGDRTRISKTYNRIVSDPRHRETEMIDFSDIEERIFCDWSMKVVQLGEYAPEVIKNVITKYSPIGTFDPTMLSPQQCLKFFEELGKQNPN